MELRARSVLYIVTGGLTAALTLREFIQSDYLAMIGWALVVTFTLIVYWDDQKHERPVEV